jgi:hypothetical protein
MILADQQIVIPLGVLIAFIGALILFVLGQVFAAIWFAAKLSTKVGIMAKSLTNLEEDMKALVKFDTKIEVLHERMNQSQADRSRIWEAIVDLRSALGNKVVQAALNAPST